MTMSFLDRISPWRRNRRQLLSMTAESRATREALAANITGLARAMEERFVSMAERIDGVSQGHAAEAEQLAGILGERLDGAIRDFRAVLDARLDGMAAEVAAMREGHDFVRVLRDLKRDIAAQISLSAFEAAAEIRGAIASGSAARLPATSAPHDRSA